MKAPDQLRALAATKRRRADELTAQANRASDNAPGGFVTGRSGRSRAQDRATARALDLTIDNAVKAGKLIKDAEHLERQAAAIEAEPRRKQVRASVAQAERRERAATAALPLANDPAAPIHLTRAQWSSYHCDYRGMLVRDGMRRRTVMRSGALGEVFITDMRARVSA